MSTNEPTKPLQTGQTDLNDGLGAVDDEIKKRTDECDECDMMANHEDPDKWYGIKKCPKCGKDTEILKQAWK